MVDEEICKRCGLCCHYEYQDKIYKCKYLVFTEKRTLCRIYRQKNRIGKIVARHDNFKVRCIERQHDPRYFKGCPYNGLAEKNTQQ